jgi:hypothetical protein
MFFVGTSAAVVEGRCGYDGLVIVIGCIEWNAITPVTVTTILV